jgi:transposase-like protein
MSVHVPAAYRCFLDGSGANSRSGGNPGDNGQMRALDLFKGRHFNWEVIVLCVRWYLGFKLSSRDLVQMMGERGIALTHTTILRWVQRYVPEFEKRWNKYSRPVGGSWRCDETYIKVKGGWTYLYRAVDKQGRTVDFLLSERRDVAAAKRFFSKALKKHGTPRVITLDAYAASHRAITELKSAGTIARRVGIRSSKYLNNVVEQDHRRIKQRTRPMLGFKRFQTAATTISGIELVEKIRKQQFKTGNLPGRPATAPDIWAAVLAA